MANLSLAPNWMAGMMRRPLFKRLAKFGLLLVILNEIRGVIVAGPVFYAMYRAGFDFGASLVGIAILAVIAASVVLPVWLWRRFRSCRA